jgi:Icc-related predicted phosphoesterase
MAFTYKSEKLYFPPTKDSNGKTRSEKDEKEIIEFDENIFEDNVMFMSDLHSHTQAVIDILCQKYDLSKFIIVTLGDMWGNGIYGSDGYPTPYYKLLHNTAKALYIIQGNHDLPPSDPNVLLRMKNKDGTNCFLLNGEIIPTTIGNIGGVHGTISVKSHPYKMPEKKYIRFLKNFKGKGLDVLLTHATPQIPYDKNKLLIGERVIYETVCDVKPRIHVYGHCYHPPVNICNNIIFLNADSKILVFKK